ncbi:MAG: hypothetical protein LLG40_15730 [Deltaproteobacteria bacterium]|nr:hypothetical protein [Deltaproteobacteria bacterium]
MEIKTTVKLDGLKELTKKYPEASKKARVSRITEALLLLERAVKGKTPVGAGPIHLRDTIFQKVSYGVQAVVGNLGTPAIYGESVEYGTQPHFPPVAPIQHWVEKKLGITGKEAGSVAYLIARAISRRGTKGQAMFGKGFAENEQAVLRILEMIPGDVVTGLSN